jgi:putative radical SAM enzyme (TIGR03279 family)
LKSGNRISWVIPGSIAEDIGIQKGDVLISINGQIPLDFLDYRYLTTDEFITLELLKSDGSILEAEIEKDYDEDLGLEFENPYMDNLKACRNRCLFCFIDQMPPKMRKTLYFKDDDYRMSFTRGNFVTLTNLKGKDIERIIEQRLSPLYVSVHTTNMELRQKMMGNPDAGNLNLLLKKLTNAGIKIHCQIVLCPGLNDGTELYNTLKDLARLYPYVMSVAVVPVGLTDYRKTLYKLETFDKFKAIGVIEQVGHLQQEFRNKLGYTFVFLADEFYLLAEKEFPPYENYEDFPQIENGVGLVAILKNGFLKLPPLPLELSKIRKVSVLTGILAVPVLKDLIEPFSHIKNLNISIHHIDNRFFGSRITVAGLVVGSDIINQLKSKELGDEVLIPEVMLKADEDVFLDGVTLNELKLKLKTNIRKVKVDAHDFYTALLGIEGEN